MINLFDIQDKKVCPAAVCYIIPELKAIMTNFPNEYLDVYAYIFFTTCPDGTNPYMLIEEDKREEVILADLKPKFYLEDLSIIAAIEKCRQLYETPTLRGYIGAKKAYERVVRYLADTEITEGKEGTSMTIDRYMSKLADYDAMCNHMGNKLKEEQSKARGDIKKRYDQKSGYKDKKDDTNERAGK